jgi:hypothetical protein
VFRRGVKLDFVGFGAALVGGGNGVCLLVARFSQSAPAEHVVWWPSDRLSWMSAMATRN